MLHRAWATLDTKALEPPADAPDERVFVGVANHVAPDSDGDIIEPKGAVFTTPLPLLLHHNTRQPIGEVIEASVEADRIVVKARVPHGEVPAYVDEAWLQLKAGLIKGLSIGFRPLRATKREAGSKGLHVLKWAWRELSAVTVPAHTQATILSVKAAAGSLPRPTATPEEVIARAKRTILASNLLMRT